MKKISLVLLAFANFIINSNAATNYAARVISYNPGAGFAAGFTNTESVLGEPSRINDFEDLTEPFNPPYGKSQILSVGEGGSVVIKFGKPIFNAPNRPFGLDFIIYGNTGFIVTNDFDPETFQWIGTPATDGSTFGHNTGATRVSVSADGRTFFVLDTNHAPVADGLFPTDGSGQFGVPVDPALTAGDFGGATAAGIRALYAGSGGGTGYNIGWARTNRGRPPHLPFIRFVRVEVLSGKVEIDAFAAVVRNASHARK